MTKLALVLLLCLPSCEHIYYNPQNQIPERKLSAGEVCELCIKNRYNGYPGCYRVVAECYENGIGGFVKNQKLAEENYWEGAINGCSDCEIIQAKRGKEMPEHYALRKRLSNRIAAEQAASAIAGMRSSQNYNNDVTNSAIINMINNSIQNQQNLQQQIQRNKPVSCSSSPKLGGGVEVLCR